MKNPAYCPAFHSGINIFVNSDNFTSHVNPCCQMNTKLLTLDDIKDGYFNHPEVKKLANDNIQGKWSPYCNACKKIEDNNGYSYRHSKINQFGYTYNLNTISTLEVMYDNTCNLACRSCGPISSTFWKKHLTDNNLLKKDQTTKNNNTINNINDTILSFLKSSKIEKIEMIKINGGETLIGNRYWQLLDKMYNFNPRLINDSTLIIQTNGTIPLRKIHLKSFERVKQVIFSVSIDGFKERFEYLRWPGKWDQLVDNLQSIKNIVPSEFAINIEETISIFNLAYQNEVRNWSKANTDEYNYNYHLAYGTFSLDHLTDEYASALGYQYVGKDFVENSEKIKLMIQTINKFDLLRGQSWIKTFPILADYYHRYI